MNIIKKILGLSLRKIKKEKHISFFILFLLSVLFILNFLSDKYLIDIPKEGGEINEVVIGEKPKFINPVLDMNHSQKTILDKTLVSLIYSPLFYKNKKGEIEENIASYKVDDSGKKYQIKLKNNIYFHDQKKMTIDDVIFTIEQIQNPENNSFYRPE
jgi:peptide/nickel transport system substrate-binding protein